MELFVIIVYGFQPLTIITECFIFDVTAVLDPSVCLIPVDDYYFEAFVVFNSLSLMLHFYTTSLHPFSTLTYPPFMKLLYRLRKKDKEKNNRTKIYLNPLPEILFFI